MLSRGISRKSMWHFQLSIWLKSSLGVILLKIPPESDQWLVFSWFQHLKNMYLLYCRAWPKTLLVSVFIYCTRRTSSRGDYEMGSSTTKPRQYIFQYNDALAIIELIIFEQIFSIHDERCSRDHTITSFIHTKFTDYIDYKSCILHFISPSSVERSILWSQHSL